MTAQLGQDRVVVPAAGTDEQLQGTALLARLRGDRFGRLALQSGQLAFEQRAGVVTLFLAREQGQVACHEGFQVVGATAHRRCRKLGIGQQSLGVGVLQNVHNGPPEKDYRQNSLHASSRLE